ncbi:MAG: ribosome small subunit-dependent GTPase [Pseudomonadota bacterium]|jgi:ribosome biogenesis GTPase
MKKTGLVVASHGRHCVVETPDGERRICHPRGKKSQVVVGDRVQWLASSDEGTIEKVEPRLNLFYRQDEIRTKSFAANLDQVLILLAAEPEFSEMQLTRALIAAEAEHINPIIVLNKRDLTELHARAFARLEPYVKMGYTVLQGAFKTGDLGDLPERLKHKTTLVLGPSGTGKSTLINALVPNANVATAEISQALNSGKHTTTSTTWHWVDAERTTGLIDSPGFQEFGVHHIDAMQLAAYMPDFKPHVATCKFYNCSHLHEPSCGVQDAVNAGAISPSRYKLYGMLFAELTQPVNY